MIFITLGSQKFQFNRLLKAVDELIQNGEITDTVFAQIGYSDYEPHYYEFKRFLNRDEFGKITDEADIVITHGGTGAIIGAVKKGKKVIAVPRRREYGEHVDDHQLQIIEQFTELGLICPCMQINSLEAALEIVQKTEYKQYESNTAVIIKSIESFIEENSVL